MTLQNLFIHDDEREPSVLPIEVVERKGAGHPDTLCDAIAERICVRLCQQYRERFGTILHHNVDKVLLCGGAAEPAFGGGRVLEPIEIYLAGRATQEWGGDVVPVNDIAAAACREVLAESVPALRIEENVRITSRIRRGSADLTSLFARAGSVPLANDTSCGVGFAPLTDLERLVLQLDRRLGSRETRRGHPAIGPDIKIMGVRRQNHIALTIGCAFIGRHVSTIREYVVEKERLRLLAQETAEVATELPVEVTVNAADDVSRKDVFLTVTGTSAEAGDDGEVGRGNRVSGLITPYRCMTLEAAAGKNPVSHVGKLYNVLAARMADAMVSEVEPVKAASVVLVSRIGHPVDEPQVMDVRLALKPRVRPRDVRAEIGRIVSTRFETLPSLREDIVNGLVRLF